MFDVIVDCVVVVVVVVLVGYVCYGDVVVDGIVVFVAVVSFGGRVFLGVCEVRRVGCCLASSPVLRVLRVVRCL